MTDKLLLYEFVASFAKFDEMWAFDLPPALEADANAVRSPDCSGCWRPAAVTTDPTALTTLYETLPGRLPPLYEQLILSYRWLQVEVDEITLLANLPGPGLVSLAKQITVDPTFVDVLFPLGFIPFARGPDVSYDPVCFDTRRRRSDGDCPVCRFEHEAILCHDRIGESWEIASSFRALVQAVVAKARVLPSKG